MTFSLAVAAAFAFATAAPAARLSLPDGLAVTVHGRPSTIGRLRAEHEARLRRFTAASAEGAAARGQIAASATRVDDAEEIMAETQAETNSKAALRDLISDVGRDVAANAAQQTNDANGNPYPVDEVNFCHAAGAPLCLYLPAGSLEISDQDPYVYLEQFDVFLDSNDCASRGGQFETGILSPREFSSVCVFYYMGLNATTGGAHLAVSQGCAAPNTWLISHDLTTAVLAWDGAANRSFAGTFVDLASTQTCSIQVSSGAAP